MHNNQMEKSRRNFMLGVTSTYAALSVSAMTGTSMILNKSHQTYKKIDFDLSDGKFSSYDALSPALIGSAISSFMLNNIEYLYSLIIILSTLFLLFTIGIPGYEYLLPYSEQYFITN